MTQLGSCLCGAVAYEVDRLVAPSANCHCRTCRKAHSAAFATTAPAARKEFRWTKGAERVRSFESTAGKLRWFCPDCGSHLIAEWVEEPWVIVRVGSLDTDPGQSPVVHIWCSQAAPWYVRGAELPELPEGR